eukprot:7011295-Alexandrium_andersonii.AAC.1
MSASLVGSEMCIRDRIPPPLEAELGAASTAPRAAPPGAMTKFQMRLTYCLLYTSDAADDM